MFSNHYNFFHAALKSERDKQKKQQKELAIDAGVSESYISELIKKKKKASQDLQEKIASLLGYTLLDFLIVGRSITEGKNFYLGESGPPYLVNPSPKLLPETTEKKTQHPQPSILDLFENKELVQSIALDLLELEKRNPEKLEMVGGYIKGVLDMLPPKKTAT